MGLGFKGVLYYTPEIPPQIQMRHAPSQWSVTLAQPRDEESSRVATSRFPNSPTATTFLLILGISST